MTTHMLRNLALASAVAVSGLVAAAQAAGPLNTIIWNGSAADGNWATPANWVGGVIPTMTDATNMDNNSALVFGASGTNTTVSTLPVIYPGSDCVYGMTFNSFMGSNPVTITNDNNALFRIGSGGITVDSGAPAVTFNFTNLSSAVRIMNNQTWTNNSSNPLTFSVATFNLQYPGGSNTTLTIDGTGDISLPTGFYSNTTSTYGTVVKNGNGTLYIGQGYPGYGTGGTPAITVNTGTVWVNGRSSVMPIGTYTVNATGNLIFDNTALGYNGIAPAVPTITNTTAGGKVTFQGNNAYSANSAANINLGSTGTINVYGNRELFYLTSALTAGNFTVGGSSTSSNGELWIARNISTAGIASSTFTLGNAAGRGVLMVYQGGSSTTYTIPNVVVPATMSGAVGQSDASNNVAVTVTNLTLG
ncbi:MAG: hypothetical protein WCI73_19245, partial [Phycisphaerae bacterium]